MQNNWLSNKADEIQVYADRNDAKRFYSALKSMYGPQSSGSSPMSQMDRCFLLRKTKFLKDGLNTEHLVFSTVHLQSMKQL